MTTFKRPATKAWNKATPKLQSQNSPKKSQRNQLLGTPLEKNPIENPENPENPIEPPPPSKKKKAPSPLQASKLLTPSMVSPSRFAPKPASEAMAREAPPG